MPKPVAFITGIAGFAGSFLAEELLEHGYRVCGGLFPGESTDNLRAISDQVTLVTLDILEPARCLAALAGLAANYVFHLAAISSVGQSFKNERLTLKVNLEGTLNVLEAARQLKALRRIVFVSSSDCYGVFRPKNMTLTERQPLNPISPYGISKAAAEQVSLYYSREHGLPVTVARSFNHSGPRQADHFVIPAFARQIAAIEAGLQKPVVGVGDLSARRDLSDVRDVARGYRLMAERGQSGRVYQLCSGKAVTIQTALDKLLGMSSKKIRRKVDPSRLRKNEIPVLRGDHHRAVRELGYEVRYPLATTLRDTLEYWREKLSTARRN